MLAFYGWTDHLLLNLLNTKLNVFPHEDADLFVLKLDRVSQKLLKEIEKTGAFRHIFFLYKPPFHKEKGPLSIGEKMTRLFSGERYYHSYQEQLRRQCGTASYRMLLSGAFWSETLFLFRYFRHYNPKIKISMVEEGTTNYSAPDGWQFHCLPTGRRMEKLMRLVYFLLTWSRARKSVEKIYLYPIEILMRQCDLSVPAEEIPEINGDNPICQRILQTVDVPPDLEPYRQHSVFFIGGALAPGYQDRFDETNHFLELMLNILGPADLAIKTHPSSGGELLAKGLEDRAFVDRSGGSINSILVNLELEKKLLITRNSSVPFSIKAQTGAEPYIIFIHRLYAFYGKHGDPVTDEATQRLAQVCAKGKVFIPDTIEELCSALLCWKTEKRLT